MHGGTLRSQFGETSEALFLTQGYVYDSAVTAETRFKGEDPGYQLFALLQSDRRPCSSSAWRARRRRGRARHRDRHGRRHHRADGPGAGRRPCRRREGAVRLLPLRGRGAPAALRHDLDAGRRQRSRRVASRDAPEHQDLLSREPDQPDARRASTSRRSPRSRTRPAPRWWSTTCSRRRSTRSPLELGADCVVYSATKHIDGQGRCLGGVILASGEVHPGQHPQPDPADRSVDVAVQRLGAAEGPGDALGAGAAADRHRRDRRGRARRASEDHADDLSRPRRPSAGRHHPPADEGGIDTGRVRDRGRQGGGLPLPGCAQAGQDHQQPRRRQEPDHPSGDHHASAPDAGAAGRTRHPRWAGAAIVRP